MARRKSSMTSAPAVAVAIFGDAYGTKEPVAPESFTRSQSNGLDWEGMYAAGENSNGFRATNPNGTLSDQGNGDNQSQYYSENKGNGKRWSPPLNWAKNGGNRTGE